MDGPENLLSGNLASIANALAAISALGLAAYGLVDTTKAFFGGISNIGFGFIRRALDPYIRAITLARGDAPFGPAEVMILPTLRANWINGTPKAIQKTTARDLVAINLNEWTASEFAKLANVDPDQFREIAKAMANDKELTTQQQGIIGRFNVILAARIDAAYEQAEQKYKSWTRALAAVFAVVLSIVGGWLVHDGYQVDGPYLLSADFLLAVLVGAVAIPIAPIAKDLSSSLSKAVSAISAVRR